MRKIVYGIYTLITTAVFLAGFPFFWLYTRLTGQYQTGLKERLGLYPRDPGLTPGSPRIWIHAASVGEVQVAEAIVGALPQAFPGARVFLSTFTLAGREAANHCLGQQVTCRLAPVDFIFSVKKAFSRVKPDIFICLETEIWPHLLIQAKKSGALTMIINGRLSVHTLPGYLRIKSFLQPVWQCVDGFSMISRADADRIQRLGAPARRIRVQGNAKFDLLVQKAHPDRYRQMQSLFQVSAEQAVLVAGSLRKAEFTILVEMYEQLRPHFPDLVFVLAPRHVERTLEIANLLESRTVRYQLRTDLGQPQSTRTAQVIILDTMGELSGVYSLARVVFCGGSLSGQGGQNPLEAAVWGVPVIHGPSMEHFEQARDLLVRAGGSIAVADGRELKEAVRLMLEDRPKAVQMGKAARQAVLDNTRVAQGQVEYLRTLWANLPR